MNALYFGDNLQILRDHLATESVDLIYLDPPFNSKRDYNLLFKSPKGHESEAQITAFEDSWHWGEQAEREFDELVHAKNTAVSELMLALRRFLGENDMMAYLTMMANRLLELHRVLKPTGSLYLHCDPTASHYLKIVLDGVLGKENFRNEIIWKRTSAHSSAKRFGPVHDTILFYAKSAEQTWNPVMQPYEESYIEQRFARTDSDGRAWKDADITGSGVRHGETGFAWRGFNPTDKGRHWAYPPSELEQMEKKGLIYWPAKQGGWPRLKQYQETMGGVPAQDVIADIFPINAMAQERLGYPTQKPLALLHRLIAASSNEGDVVLDPFCGCGTAVHAAQKLKRKWIGIDITHLAISLVEKRLKDAFGKRCKYEVHGTPKDVEGARDLMKRKPDGAYQFQWWAVSLVEAQPFQGRKKGADGGIDGLKYFGDYEQKVEKLSQSSKGASKTCKIVVSVKGGGIKADDVRSLLAVREREAAEIALFISLEAPTRGMIADAASAGFYQDGAGRKFPRVQLLTIEGLLAGTQRAEHPDHQPDLNFKKARAEAHGNQADLI